MTCIALRVAAISNHPTSMLSKPIMQAVQQKLSVVVRAVFNMYGCLVLDGVCDIHAIKQLVTRPTAYKEMCM